MEKKSSQNVSKLEREIKRLSKPFQLALQKKQKDILQFVSVVKKHVKGLDIGFYIVPEVVVKNNQSHPNFENLTLHFLLDDFEKPITEFNPKLLLGREFSTCLKQKGDDLVLKSSPSITFKGTSISQIRERCFDGNYDDLKSLGKSLIVEDNRGFISALKTIDIHKTMLLQKFEKYIVVYAGAGSWLRGEKSNDFDVFVVIDDTDVKKMSRTQVKEQISGIIWQMAREVEKLTSIQIHIQTYLLTDFWDSLKDAHPVIFTFLRDGVPFYDRGLYSSWKELLKLGKIRPSPESIDMHMNLGVQLLDRVKKRFKEVVSSDIYNAVLSPSQAILMLKGYNPTTPKETIKMFKEVLLKKEKIITKTDVNCLEETVSFFKKIEHDKDLKLSGKEVDRLINNAEKYLSNIRKLFKEISEGKTKESVVNVYLEIIVQLRTLPNFENLSEESVLSSFKKYYILTGKVPLFLEKSIENVVKAKEDYKKGKLTVTEVNKIQKEARTILLEIKILKEKNVIQTSKNVLGLIYGDGLTAEIFSTGKGVFLVKKDTEQCFKLVGKEFVKCLPENVKDLSQRTELLLTSQLISSAKKLLKVRQLKV